MLEELKESKQTKKPEKRKLHEEEVCHLKTKKKRTENEIKSLHKSADDQAKKAEDQNEMTLQTQSNSLRNTAHAKEKCLKQVR